MAKTKKGIVKGAIMKAVDGSPKHEVAESKGKEVSEGKNDKEVDLPFKKYSNLKK